MEHYFLRYDIKTGEVLGHFVSSSNEIVARPRSPG